MASHNYKELNPEDYLQLQNALLKEKGGDAQREFLEVTNDNDDFLSFMEKKIRVVNGGPPLPLFDGALTESSFKEPTQDQECRMYEIWRAVPPRTACRVSFWAEITLEHIRSGKIGEASWLAVGRSTKSGEERIERALNMNGDSSAKEIDTCVRTVFRRMSGLLGRGNRSVFANPTFGRAWWRERIVSRVLEREQEVESREALLEVVRCSQDYWERLVTMIVSRGSVFGSVDVQDALVNGLARHLKDNPGTPLRHVSPLAQMLRRFSNLAASREIGILDFNEISAIVDDLIARFRTHRNGAADESGDLETES